MNLYLIGWNLPKNRTPIAVTELLRMIDIYPQLDPTTHWHHTSPTGMLFMASMHTADLIAAPRRYIYQNEDEVIFYAGLPVDPTGTCSAHIAKDLSANWDKLSDKLEGQHVLIRGMSNPDSLEIVTDFLGFEQAFCYHKDDMWLISNSVHLIERVCGPSALDPVGASIFLSTGIVGDHRTLREDIKIVPGGQHWKWQKGDTRPTKKSYFSSSSLARSSYQRLTPSFINELSDEMIQLCRILSQNFESISCSLTGGRDSRVLAALLIHAGLPAQFYTSGDPSSADVKIAKLIAKSLDLPHKIMPINTDDVLNDWDNVCTQFIRQNDGMVSLKQIADMLNYGNPVNQLDIFFWGAGGEIARGYNSEPEILFGKRNVADVQTHLVKKLVHSRGGLIKQEAISLAKDYTNRFVTQYADMGFSPIDIPDLFHTFEQVNNWFGLAARISMMTNDLFTPFCSRAFVRAVFSLSPQQRWTEPLHYALIRKLAPELHAIPFAGKPWGPQHPGLNILLKYWTEKIEDFRSETPNLLRGIKKRITRSKKEAPAFGKITWIENVGQRVREVCMDQSSSSLWDYVNRPIFERVISSLTSPEVTYKQKMQIYAIATLFYYEAGASREKARTIS